MHGTFRMRWANGPSRNNHVLPHSAFRGQTPEWISTEVTQFHQSGGAQPSPAGPRGGHRSAACRRAEQSTQPRDHHRQPDPEQAAPRSARARVWALAYPPSDC
jgi:hypothetical protein